MTARLYYSYGDPDYLKIALLQQILHVHDSTLTNHEGVPPKVFLSPTNPSLHLVLSSGQLVFLANEICRFVSVVGGGGGGMWGCDPRQRAMVDYWLDWEAGELKPAVKETLKGGKITHTLLTSLGRLEGHLSKGAGFIVGPRLSLADIVVWASLYVLLTPEGSCAADLALHKDHPVVCQWFISLAREEHFTSAVWKASRDEGFDAFRSFLVGKSSAQPVAREPRSKPVASGNSQSDCKVGHGCSGVKVGGKKNNRSIQRHLDAPPPPEAESSTEERVSPEEIAAAKEAWSPPDSAPKPAARQHPILPVPGARNILITSALPYVNNVPHLGNIIGCVLSADVFSRYCRLRGYNSLYICGTDEYGTATETKAVEEGVTPQDICAKYHAIHSEIYSWFNIDFDYFGRTSTPQQTEIAQEIFWRLHQRDFISHDIVEQLQCRDCERFLADRFVEGICPICAYEDARGDQCDKCGKLINAIDLKSPRCKVCSGTPRVRTSNHIFLDLSKLQPTVSSWFQESTQQGIWSYNANHITSSWLRDGLKPRCISRDLKWGTPVPLEGYTDKVFYVWFDAPIGYLSITACYTENWEKWWKNPNEVELYQFMAKDNVPFHTVIFPCSLLGSQDNYTLLNHISSTEYLNYEDGKFSKSRGVGVFGNDAKDTVIPADVYRFYLLYIRPETQDSAFSWTDFATKVNSELLNNLGNFVNRSLTFLAKNFNSTVPDMLMLAGDYELVAMVTKELQAYMECLDKIRLRDGIRHILNVSRLGNVYLQGNTPWKLIKGTPEDKSRAGTVLAMSCNLTCLLSVMLHPYMPAVSQQIYDQLQAPEDCKVLFGKFVPFLQPGHRIGQPVRLFSKIEDETVQELKDKFGGQQMKKVERGGH